MRINVISICYWPEPTGIGPYTTGTAEYLASRGDDVTAIVGMPHFPAWKRDRSYTTRPQSRNGVQIIRFNHSVPRRHTAFSRGTYELSFFVSAGLSARLPAADASLAVVPNVGAACVALLRRRRGGPYGVIVQDLSGRAAAQSGTPGGTGASQVTALVEGKALRSAAFVGVVSEAFAAPLLDLGVDPSRIIHVPNWTHVPAAKGCRAEIRQMFGWSEDTTIALHAGNMGRKQALETVVDSARAAAAANAPVRFVLMGDGNQRAHLESYGRGVRTLQFLPPQPTDLFPEVLAAADVLILSERASVKDMSLPSKLTSYFSVGRPVVASVREGGSTAAELARARAAVVVTPEDAAALLDGIVMLRRDSVLASRLGEAGRRYSQTELTPHRTLEALRRAIHAVAAGQSPALVPAPPAGHRESTASPSQP